MIAEAAKRLNKAEIEAILVKYSAPKRSRSHHHHHNNNNNNKSNNNSSSIIPDTLRDPASRSVLRNLEDNAAYFLDNFSERVNKYNAELLDVTTALKGSVCGQSSPTEVSCTSADTIIEGNNNNINNNNITLENKNETSKLRDEISCANTAGRLLSVVHPRVKIIRDLYIDDYLDEMTTGSDGVTVLRSLLPPAILPCGAVRAEVNDLVKKRGRGSKTISIDNNNINNITVSSSLGVVLTKEALEANNININNNINNNADDDDEDDDSDDQYNTDESSCLDIATDCSDPPQAEDLYNIDTPSISPLMHRLSTFKAECYGFRTTLQGLRDFIILIAPGDADSMDQREEQRLEVLMAMAEVIENKEDVIEGLYDMEVKYLTSRSEACKQLMKYPYITTFAQQIMVLDSDAWNDLMDAWRMLIRVNLHLFTLIGKNIDAILGDREGGHRGTAQQYIYQ